MFGTHCKILNYHITLLSDSLFCSSAIDHSTELEGPMTCYAYACWRVSCSWPVLRLWPSTWSCCLLHLRLCLKYVDMLWLIWYLGAHPRMFDAANWREHVTLLTRGTELISGVRGTRQLQLVSCRYIRFRCFFSILLIYGTFSQY